MTFLDRSMPDGSAPAPGGGGWADPKWGDPTWVDPDVQVRSPGGASVTTYVSLFMLLFVFFIVLFSIAQVQRDRSQAVLAGLDRALGRLPSALGLISVPRPALDRPSSATEGFARDVGTLLTQFGTFALDPDAVGDGLVLAVDLSVDGLFQPHDAALRAEAGPLVDRLAVMLQRGDDGRRYRLVWHVLLPAGVSRNGAEARLAVARGAALASALYLQGCPGDGVALSVDSVSHTAPRPGIRWDFTLIDGGRPPGPLN
jgi:hypothetical protein